jgi:hypothetical protein
MATDSIEPKYTVFDLGYERCLAKTDSFYDDQGANADKVTDSLPSILIGGGGLIGNITMVDGFMQSSNYVAGSTGWKLTETTAYLPSIDLSGYLLATGGAYKTAASGSRVEIFPDINTGLQVIDDAANDVFKCVVGGTDVGDVIIGNYGADHGMFYDKSEATFNVKGSIIAGDGSSIAAGYLVSGIILSEQITLGFTEGAGDCVIKAGKTDFGQYTTDGFILGIDDSDSNATKFELTGGEIYGTMVNFYFGDGVDGDYTLDGTNNYSTKGMTNSGTTYTLTRDIYAVDLNVLEGSVLNTDGYRIFVLGTLTRGGTIQNNGGNGGNGDNAVTQNGGDSNTSGGTGGLGGGASGSTLGKALDGGSGGGSHCAFIGVLANSYSHAGTAGTNKNPSLGVSGVAGGDGAKAYLSGGSNYGTNQAGGSGGVATTEQMKFELQDTLYSNSAYVIDLAALFLASGVTSGNALSHSASSGGGGAGHWVGGGPDAGNYRIAGGGGGGAGGNGGIIYIAAKTITGSGLIQSLGGDGGDGGSGGSLAGYFSSGKGGGGAGGNGGVIVLIYKSGSPGTLTVTGGTRGYVGSSGASLGATDGTDGNNGKWYIFRIKT